MPRSRYLSTRDLEARRLDDFGVRSSRIPGHSWRDKSRTSSRSWRGQSCSALRDRTPHARRYQQPRQMPFTLRSIVLFSSLIAASTSVVDLADPVVTPLPDDCAVPALLVPGAGGAASLDEFPAPLGSWPALFNPPGLAGPEGTPLMPDVPAPADPALGEPAALPLPADDPPALCANEVTGDIRIAIAVTAMVAEALFIENLLYGATTAPSPCS